jgi:hypothetical protein
MDTKDQQLIHTIKEGRYDAVYSLIKLGCNVNCFEGAPLFLATKNGDWRIMNLLLENGAKINNSILMYVAKTDNCQALESMIKVIIENQGQASHLLYDNLSDIFMMACENGSICSIIYLINFSNKQSHYSPSAKLMEAIEFNFMPVVSLILTTGIQIRIPQLLKAILHKKSDIFDLFVKKMKSDKILIKKNLKCSSHYQYEILGRLVSSNYSILEILIKYEMIHCARNLINMIKDSSILTSTLIELALENSYYNLLQLLIEKGCPIDYPSFLYQIIKKNNIPVLNLILKDPFVMEYCDIIQNIMTNSVFISEEIEDILTNFLTHKYVDPIND